MDSKNNICRICMTVTDDLIPMIKITSENTADLLNIGEMFEECFGVMIDEIPKYYRICMNCKIQLTYFHDFKLQAIKTHQKLLKMETSVEIKDESTSGSASASEKEGSVKEENVCNDESLFIEYLEDEDSVVEGLKSSTVNMDEDYLETEYLGSEQQYTIQYLEDHCDLVATNDELFQLFDGDENNKESTRKEEANTSKVKWKNRCEPCGKYFRNEVTYNAHLNVHKGLPAYKCETCNKGFGFKVNYDYHMKNHNNNRSFKCTSCDKSFLCKWDLKIHVRVHEDVRPFVCDICGKQFRVRSHMTDHLETHNEENVHECPICQQKYKTRATLKMHISSIHVKDKQYFCPICDRAFNRKHHLKVHFKVHDNIKKEMS